MKYPIELSQSSPDWLHQCVRKGILIWTSLLIVMVPLSTARARRSVVEIASRKYQSTATGNEETKRTGDVRTLDPGKPAKKTACL